MRSFTVAGAAACAILLAASSPAQAEGVSVAAHPAELLPSSASVLLPAAAWPRVVVIARLQLGGRGRMSEGWWRSNGYRPATLYYVDGRYYDRWDDRYRGRDVRRVLVYERGGRFYRDWDDDDDQGDRYGSRGGYGGRDGYGDRGQYGGRDGYGDRGQYGGRDGYGDRGRYDDQRQDNRDRHGNRGDDRRSDRGHDHDRN